MSAIIDAVAYILKEYPHKGELSNARVTKMLYLADWYCAINETPCVTDIQWYFDNHGPFVWDVKDAVERSNIAKINSTTNQYGTKKEIFQLVRENYRPILTENDRNSLDHVILETSKLYWSDFITLVYSTYPVASSNRYTYLDLIRKASIYRRENPNRNLA